MPNHAQRLGHGGQQFDIAGSHRPLHRGQGQPGGRDIGKNAAKTDGHQQQRLEVPHNGEVEQSEPDQDHDELAELHLGHA